MDVNTVSIVAHTSGAEADNGAQPVNSLSWAIPREMQSTDTSDHYHPEQSMSALIPDSVDQAVRHYFDHTTLVPNPVFVPGPRDPIARGDLHHSASRHPTLSSLPTMSNHGFIYGDEPYFNFNL